MSDVNVSRTYQCAACCRQSGQQAGEERKLSLVRGEELVPPHMLTEARGAACIQQAAAAHKPPLYGSDQADRFGAVERAVGVGVGVGKESTGGAGGCRVRGCRRHALPDLQQNLIVKPPWRASDEAT
eukprot:7391483-Prymnesium_polylepis.3